MTKNQYENIVETTIKNEPADKDGLGTVRDILKNLGIGFPKGDVKDIRAALETEDFMGWEKCDSREAAAEALENGTPVIAVTGDKVYVVTGERGGPDLTNGSVTTQEELKKLPGVLMYMYSGDTTDDPEDYPAAPHFTEDMFIKNSATGKYLVNSGGTPALISSPVSFLDNSARWRFSYSDGSDNCYISSVSDLSKKLCVDDSGDVCLESSELYSLALKWNILKPNLQGTDFLIRNGYTVGYLTGANAAPYMNTAPIISSEWIIVVATDPIYTYPSSSRIISRGYSSADGHYGLDIGGYQDAVYAIADGFVAYTQTSDVEDQTMATMGNAIAINHNNPDPDICSGQYARSIYMHLDSPSDFAPGVFVSKGTQIGLMGKTGNADGAHLHFELSVGNNSAMAPGQQGWISHPYLPNLNAVVAYFPEYHL